MTIVLSPRDIDELAQRAYSDFCSLTSPLRNSLDWFELPPMVRDAWRHGVTLVINNVQERIDRLTTDQQVSANPPPLLLAYSDPSGPKD